MTESKTFRISNFKQYSNYAHSVELKVAESARMMGKWTKKGRKRALESNQHKKSIILNVICSHVTFIAKVFCKIKRRKTKGKVFNGAGKWCAFNVTDLFNY